MLLTFNDEGADRFRAGLRDWLSDAVPAEWLAYSTGQVHLPDSGITEMRRRWDRTVFAGGYAGLAWPGAFGGKEVGPIEELIFFEECARAHAPEGLGTIGRQMVGPLLIEFGSDAQRARYLQRILTGDEYWCQGYSEPTAGSDLSAMKTMAIRDGDTYLVSGTKIWTSGAQYSDKCMLLARTSTELPRGHNISIFLLDMRQPGVSIAPIKTALGRADFNEVTFANAVVSAEDRVGEESEGWQLVLRSLVHERGTQGGVKHYVEICRHWDMLASCCARDGQMAGLEPLRIRKELVLWHAMRATEMLAQGRDAYPELVVYKLFWSGVKQEVASKGLETACAKHQSFWWSAYISTLPATIAGGTNDIQRNTIARRVVARQPTQTAGLVAQ
jgi:alkylation response protein AidB-like acyl-CoA dehydrogenase